MRKSLLLFLGMIAMIFMIASEGFSMSVAKSEGEGDSFKPSLNVFGRVQAFWDTTMHKTETDRGNAGTGGSHFAARRIRLGANSEVIKNVTAHVDIQFGGTGVSTTTVPPTLGIQIIDAFINYQLIPVLGIKAGQMTQYLTPHTGVQSSGKIMLSDYSRAISTLSLGSDMGLEVKGDFTLGGVLDSIHFAIGLSNGGGARLWSSNYGANRAYNVYGRLEFDFLKPWMHGDMYLKNDMAFTLGVALEYAGKLDSGDSRGIMSYGVTGRKSVYAFIADLGFNIPVGPIGIYGEAGIALAGGKDQASSTSLENYTGVYFDLGVMFIPKTLQLALRLENYEETPLSTGLKDGRTALWIGLNWFPGGSHAFKVQPNVIFDLDRKTERSTTARTKADKEAILRLALTANI